MSQFAQTDHNENAAAVAADRANVWHHLSQHKAYEQADPMLIVEGQGMRVRDAKGNEYLDAVSGAVWTVNVGYGRTRIADAVREQLVKMCYFANTAGTVPGALFAENLLQKAPGMDRVYYSNSGSEANEKAYKIVRQMAQIKNGGKKHKIIYRDRDYHGTTIAALSSTGQSQRRDHYGPFAPGFAQMPSASCYRCPFGKQYGKCNIECARALEDVIIQEGGAEEVGAVVLEPITAGGGVIVPVPEYYPIIQEICRKYDVLIHIDEVVCGLGRTGKWFGHHHFDLEPDMITMAKGVASGYAAISCTLTSESVFEVFKSQPEDNMAYFRDISTFGGCAGGHAAALENLKILEEEDLVSNSARMGEYLTGRLQELQTRHELIGDVRGKGLFQGLELVSDRTQRTPVHESVAVAVAQECHRRGVIIGRTNRSFAELNNTLCLSPALIATENDLDEIVTAIDESLSVVSNA